MSVIQEIGSYAGLAAIPALAVLAVLYFSQARDVRRLREWAGRAPERAAEAARRSGGTRPAEPQVAARPRESQVAPTPREQPAAQPAPTEQPAAQPAPTEQPAAQRSPREAPAQVGAATPAAVATSSRPRTREDEPPTATPPRTSAAPRRWSWDEESQPSPLAGRLASARIGPIALAVAAIVVIALIVVILSQSGSSPTASKSAQRTQTTVTPAQVTVGVLNATGVSGVAHQVGARVSQAGFRLAGVGNAAGRQDATSAVLYLPGQADASRLVSQALGVRRVAPADRASESEAPHAGVIVVVGADMTQAGASGGTGAPAPPGAGGQ